MDCGIHIIQIADVILDARQLRSICQQTLHLGLGSAITEFQVVQHRIIAFGKSLICRLDGLHVRAHLVGIVCHVNHSSICHFGGCGCVSVHRGDQCCGKRCDVLHVFVCGYACGLVRFRRIPLDYVSIFPEQCFNTAKALLEFRAFVYAVADKLTNGGTHTDRSSSGKQRFT